MSSFVEECACWRIWYRLKVRGPLWEENLMANCGIHSDLFDKAIDGMMSMGMIEEAEHDDCKDRSKYKLIADEPRMMQVFPTLGGLDD